MYLLYCDETNLEQRHDDFFVYGGIVVNGDSALELSTEMDSIRTQFGVPPDFTLKFNPGPEHLDHAKFIELKQAIIEAATQHHCIFLVSMILHNIATSANEARRNEINRVTYHFDCLLKRIQSHGIVLIDRFEDGKIDGHLRKKFSVGLEGLPYSDSLRLKHIVGFHYSAIGQAHFPSVVDIILGSLRFSINAFTRSQDNNMTSARTILRLLSPLFDRMDNGVVSELSLFFSPKKIDMAAYRVRYQELKDFLTEQGVEPYQEITGERTY